MAEGCFREDLYYRLAAFPIRLPPLRERTDDVALLVEHFLVAAEARHGRRVPALSARAVAALGRHRWPGNVRELEHEIERAVALIAEVLGRHQGNVSHAARALGLSRPMLHKKIKEYGLR